MKKLICLFLLFLAFKQGFAQINKVQFEQIDGLQITEKRNVIVFIHTDWCKYCKVMQNKTFKNENVIELINNNFYFTDFNAEEKRQIKFNNNIFSFKPNGNNSGIHELAIELGTINNQINYPILCVLNERNEIIFQYNRLLNTKDLIKILGSF